MTALTRKTIGGPQRSQSAKKSSFPVTSTPRTAGLKKRSASSNSIKSRSSQSRLETLSSRKHPGSRKKQASNDETKASRGGGAPSVGRDLQQKKSKQPGDSKSEGQLPKKNSVQSTSTKANRRVNSEPSLKPKTGARVEQWMTHQVPPMPATDKMFEIKSDRPKPTPMRSIKVEGRPKRSKSTKSLRRSNSGKDATSDNTSQSKKKQKSKSLTRNSSKNSRKSLGAHK